MTWKQTLGQLKQELKNQPDGGPAPKPSPPPKPLEPPKPLDEEDAVFLAAMGRKAPARSTPHHPFQEPDTPPSEATRLAPEAEVSFESAMADLKGLKPRRPPAPPPPAPVPTPPTAPADTSPEPRGIQPPAPAAEPESKPIPSESSPGPRLIHLAAGMAIEVDGSLDLRAHSVQDARDRLLERLQDGRFLGWRTLHVQLGEEESLRAMLLDILAESASTLILQYAQAPVPMGGRQAWILYFNIG